MDKCTREVRKQYWKNIITQCLQRPEGMTVKQWLEDNGICEQNYYHWLKRITEKWTGAGWNWGQTLDQLCIYFEGRITPADID